MLVKTLGEISEDRTGGCSGAGRCANRNDSSDLAHYLNSHCNSTSPAIPCNTTSIPATLLHGLLFSHNYPQRLIMPASPIICVQSIIWCGLSYPLLFSIPKHGCVKNCKNNCPFFWLNCIKIFSISAGRMPRCWPNLFQLTVYQNICFLKLLSIKICMFSPQVLLLSDTVYQNMFVFEGPVFFLCRLLSSFYQNMPFCRILSTKMSTKKLLMLTATP